MKIVIKAGTTIEEATELLSNFLKENYSEFPLLRNNANIYINISNQDGKPCPDNEQEFHLSKDDTFNATKDIEKTAIDNCLSSWKTYVNSWYAKKKRVIREIGLDKKYLESAERLKRSPENIYKRKGEYKNHCADLEMIERNIKFIKELDQAVIEGKYSTHIIKSIGKETRGPSVFVLLQFKDVNGYTGYFDGIRLKEGVYKQYLKK